MTRHDRPASPVAAAPAPMEDAPALPENASGFRERKRKNEPRQSSTVPGMTVVGAGRRPSWFLFFSQAVARTEREDPEIPPRGPRGPARAVGQGSGYTPPGPSLTGRRLSTYPSPFPHRARSAGP